MSQPLLITGASGQLGAYVLRAVRGAGEPVVGWSGPGSGRRAGPRADGSLASLTDDAGIRLLPIDLTCADEVARAFRTARPRWVLHLAAVSQVEACRKSPGQAWRVNVEATRQLVELADESNAALLLASTDMVFDGLRGGYVENDEPRPLSEYGRTKMAAERIVEQARRGLVIRLSLLFGPSRNGRSNFFDAQCEALRRGERCPLFRDEWRTPLSLPAAAECLLRLVRSGRSGIFHVGGPERLSRWEMGRRLARELQVDESLVVPDLAATHAFAEPRPRDVSLDSRRVHQLLPGLPRLPYVAALRRMLES